MLYFTGDTESYRDYLISSGQTSDLTNVIERNTAREIAAGEGMRSAVLKQSEMLASTQRGILEGVLGAGRLQARGFDALLDQGKQTQDIMFRGFSNLSWKTSMGFSDLSREASEMNFQLGALRSSFIQGFALINDNLVKASKDICGKLDAINENLSNPYQVQSRELYNRALVNYKKGFYEEALEDLSKSLEINKTNYLSWFLLGKLYLFGAGEFSCVVDLDASISALMNAAKYIKPDIAVLEEARLTAADMLFYLGLARQTNAKERAFEEKTKPDPALIAEAKKAYEQSFAYSPGMLEALYNAARCDILLDDREGALKKFEAIIREDRMYAVKPLVDPDFAPLLSDLSGLIEYLKAELYLEVWEKLDELSRLAEEYERSYGPLPSQLEEELAGLRALTKVSSYFDVLDAVEKAAFLKQELFDIIEQRKQQEKARKQQEEAKRQQEEAKYNFTSDYINIDGITITSYSGGGNHLVILSRIGGKPVTGIGDSVFYNNTGLTSVVIPEGVTSIGENAFRDCTSLSSVLIPKSVTSIQKQAFFGCTRLRSVVIPEGVTYIREGVFKGCTGLTSIVIPEGVTSIKERAFEDCTGLTSVVIPKGVTSIGNQAFCNCTGLRSVIIPEGVTSIGMAAFAICTGLESVIISEGVTSIGNQAFQRCTGLTSLVIPESVTSIGHWAFEDCTALTSVLIPEGYPYGQIEKAFPLSTHIKEKHENKKDGSGGFFRRLFGQR